MAYATVTIPGDGTTTLITASFPLGYINQSDVTIRVTDEVDGGGNPVYRTYTKMGLSLYQVAGAPAAVGKNYIVERRVSKTALLVDWEDGDAITEDNLDVSQKQSIMIAQEALDQATFSVRTSDNSQGPLITRGTEGSLPQWDAFGNLVPGPDATDIEDAQANAALAAAAASSASGSASASAGSAANSAASATLAQQWANENEDVVVSGGLFSAKHWAAKAAASALAAANAVLGVWQAAVSKTTPVDADRITILDSAASLGAKYLSFANLKTWIQNLGAAFAYNRGNIRGTVSQSGGVPTGAMFEAGNTGNQFYIRFPDGTMLCWGNLSSDTGGPVTTNFGSPFINNGYKITLACSSASTLSAAAKHSSKTTGAFDCVVNNNANAYVAFSVDYIAVGKWV